MDFHMLAIFLVLVYIIVIVAVFIVFIRILQLLEGELYNQRYIDEQGGNRSPNRPNS
jgi:cell division protein FtsI/penicillin-binding protein 2